MTNNKRIFFDLDGTLTDPKLGITRCITHAIESLDINAPNEVDLTWCIGPPLLGSFEQLVGKKLASVALSFYRERFADVGWAENIPYDGIHTTLGELRNRDYELFVATSKPHIYAKEILHHFQLDQFFEHVYGSELSGVRSDKTDLLEFAISDAGISTASSMVGDRKYDMIGALANKITPVGVSYGYGTVQELEEAGASTILRTPMELTHNFVNS